MNSNNKKAAEVSNFSPPGQSPSGSAARSFLDKMVDIICGYRDFKNLDKDFTQKLKFLAIEADDKVAEKNIAIDLMRYTDSQLKKEIEGLKKELQSESERQKNELRAMINKE